MKKITALLRCAMGLMLALTLAACASPGKTASANASPTPEQPAATAKAAPQAAPQPYMDAGAGRAARGAVEPRAAAAPPNRDETNKDFVIVPVYYGTDRNRVDPQNPAKGYGPKRGNGLETGICEVSIPKTHVTGEVELPKWYYIWMENDPSKHFILKSVTPFGSIGAFAAELRGRLAKLPKNEIVVFVHGYMNSFEDAAMRTAQMAYDLKFEGAAAFFSWPSAGEVAGYTFDENNMEWAIPHLEEYLRTLARQTGAKKLHVIAHSMGNRIFSRAVLSLRQENPALALNEVILAAPDIDAAIFMRDIAPKIRQAGHVTVYFSPKDGALAVSNKIHGDYPRVGQGTSLRSMDGIDLIDAEQVDSSLTGHSYVADSTSILSDIHLLLVKGMRSPAERCLEKNSGGWAWQVQPATQKICFVKKPPAQTR